MSIVCVLSAIMVGLVPALQASKIGLADVGSLWSKAQAVQSLPRTTSRTELRSR